MANRELVAKGCQRATAAGIIPDMTLAHARALLDPSDDLIVHAHDDTRDRHVLERLATWAMRFSPVVAPDPPDGLLLDVTGCMRVHQSDEQLLTTMACSLRQLGFQTHIASASTFGCAWALARYGDRENNTVVPAGREQYALAPLPIAALRLDPDVAEQLSELGVECIGELMALPRLELAARFPPALLHRLDQATGQKAESIIPVRLRTRLTSRMEFDGPVRNPEGIRRSTEQLLKQLIHQLTQQELGVRRLDFNAQRIDAHPVRITIQLSRPSRSHAHLMTLLAPRLEKLNLGYGVEALEIHAQSTVIVRHRQTEHDPRWLLGTQASESKATQDREIGELVDTLTDRLGLNAVTSSIPYESHLPEHAFQRTRVQFPQPAVPIARITPANRPSRLEPSPIPITVSVLTSAGPPASLQWRGTTHQIHASSGPERISLPWWRTQSIASGDPHRASLECRSYFAVQVESGRWLWIYRDEQTNRWFLHGEWA